MESHTQIISHDFIGTLGSLLRYLKSQKCQDSLGQLAKMVIIFFKDLTLTQHIIQYSIEMWCEWILILIRVLGKALADVFDHHCSSVLCWFILTMTTGLD